ncbi:Glycosyl hydrolases family 16 [Treponema bryantii]|uniref:Glycosyl hydrolases family 16 n=1 Tax=Treponema bryantii TaxID=163 RepID=A0A1I3NHG3_9SPIR|nr:glycoside hydrolase family 16 protein [Treponema bryantii]SFJ08619.1 Glycosyl hydrolases family 16 [Treponema bryantii]
MKKQLSNITRLLLLSGVAVIMSTSCMFLPQKEVEETLKPEDKEGLTLVWQDEFNYTGVPDVNKWKYQTGDNGWGNHELQNYLDNSTEAKTAVVEDGVLKIKAFKENNKWVSARLNSKESWKYGFIEGRLKITDRKGAWPAFWMMPQNSVYGDWPKSGEIDIMENAPSTCGNHKVFSTLHAEGHYGGNGKSIGRKVYGDELSSEWHTFAVKWEENKISCYYDDVLKGSYENDRTTANWPYNEDFYIILNLAIGGDLGGPLNDVNTLGGEAEFLIDYIRVYQ